jgi:hypothetical protein
MDLAAKESANAQNRAVAACRPRPAQAVHHGSSGEGLGGAGGRKGHMEHRQAASNVPRGQRSAQVARCPETDAVQ